MTWIRNKIERLFVKPCYGMDPRCEWAPHHNYHLTFLGMLRYGPFGDTGA